MTFDGLVIKYNGFHPSFEKHTLLEQIMGKIFDKAPFGSNLQVNFSKKKKLIKASISIKSAAGPFFCSAAGEDILEVAQHLSIKMLDRLEKWKTERFESSESDQSADETPPSGSTLAS
jgi:hypothetical protein